MTRIKEYIRRYTKAELLLYGLVFVQIAYLLVFNIFRTKYVINLDSSEYMIQVMQIWKQKTLLIEDYYYSTMLTWDMPTLIAVLFYGIFGDVFLAYGLANNVLIVLFALMLNKLCNDLEYSKIGKGLVFFAIFTVYHYGYVDYIEELFVNGALYGFRILFMLMLMDVLICMHKQISMKNSIILYIICLVGCFVCGLSSGIFELGCCILPVVLYELWHVLAQERNICILDFIQKKTILPVGAVIVCALGIVVNYLLGFNGSSAAVKTTIKATEMMDNIAGNFVGIFQLFGWSDTQSYPITSLEGIMEIMGFVIGCVTILVFVLATRISIKNTEKEFIVSIQRNYGQMVFFVFLVNVLLFCLADLTYSSATCEYRYWLMIIIPVFVEIGMVYDWAKKRISYNYRVFLVILYVMLLCLISGYKDVKLWKVDNGADSFEQMMDKAEEENLETIFIYGDYFTSRVFSSFAKESMEVFAVANETIDDKGSAWISNQLRMPRWGTYVKYDTDCMSTDTIKGIGVFVSSKVGEDYKLLTLRAKEIISFEDSSYKLLIMDTNYLDFEYGIPEDGMLQSKDYLNWGYDRDELYLNAEGYYQTTECKGCILSGNFIANETGLYSAELYYDSLNEGKGVIGEFIITVTDDKGKETIYKQNISSDNKKVVLENVEIQKGDVYTVSVSKNLEQIFVLKQIKYFKKGKG